MEEVRIEIPHFATHIPKSRNKYVKVNGQSIYSGNMNHFTRNKLSDFLKDYLRENIPNDLVITPPVSIELEFHVPINYGTVRRIKDKSTGEYRISWKVPTDDYRPTWDCDNQWIWNKCFLDALVAEGKIPDDNILYVRSSGTVHWKPVETFDDRKLVFVIKPYRDETSDNANYSNE